MSIAGDDGSIVTSTLTHDDDESDESSVDTSVFVQMAVAKRETQRLQRRLEKVRRNARRSNHYQISRPFQKQEKLLSEKLPVLAKSVSHYNSIVSFPTVLYFNCPRRLDRRLLRYRCCV